MKRGVPSGHIGNHEGVRKAAGDGETGELGAELGQRGARRKIGDIRIGWHVVEIDIRAKADGLEVEHVKGLGELGPAGVAVHESAERHGVVNHVINTAPREERGVRGVDRDRR